MCWLRGCRVRCQPASAISGGWRIAQRRYLRQNSKFLQVSDEVRASVNDKIPVVGLETTIYTHGFPYPDNIVLATRLEQLVRQNGAIPAHCAVLDGVARVGLRNDEMQRLLQDSKPRKVSRRDLGIILGLGSRGRMINGGTTIAGTMILSHLAGIKVFATGGLGGVHRGFEQMMDVSADLTELGRTPVAVISAGCKGFLDIPRTIEYLETEGVPVATFADGRKGNVYLPSFWSRESNIVSPFTVNDEQEAAAMIHAHFSLPLTSGMLFANPVPFEHSIDAKDMSNIIDEALKRADAAGVTGAANTPYVLNAIKELSGGRSIPANRALIEANIIRGTRVAVELSRLEQGLQPEVELDGRLPASAFVGPLTCSQSDPSSDSRSSDLDGLRAGTTSKPTSREQSQITSVDIVVAGSIALDFSCDYRPATFNAARNTQPRMETSNPAAIRQSIGGVGCNIAKAIHLAGGSVRFCSAIGTDPAGIFIENGMRRVQGLDSRFLVSQHGKTAQYVAVNDANKALVLGMADMDIFDEASIAMQNQLISTLESSAPKWLVMDGNWSSDFLRTILVHAKHRNILTAFEPVSTVKSTRLFSSSNQDSQIAFPTPLVDLSTPNKVELTAMYASAEKAGLFSQQPWWRVIDALGISSAGARVELVMATSSELVDQGIPQRCIQLLPFIPCILTKLGSEGVLMAQLLKADDPRLKSPEAAPYILARSETQGEGVGGVYLRLFPPVELVPAEEIVSVNGVGDTFVGVLMAALTKREGVLTENAVQTAQRASVLSLKSAEAVSPEVERLRLALEII